MHCQILPQYFPPKHLPYFSNFPHLPSVLQSVSQPKKILTNNSMDYSNSFPTQTFRLDKNTSRIFFVINQLPETTYQAVCSYCHTVMIYFMESISTFSKLKYSMFQKCTAQHKGQTQTKRKERKTTIIPSSLPLNFAKPCWHINHKFEHWLKSLPVLSKYFKTVHTGLQLYNSWYAKFNSPSANIRKQ